MEQIGKVIRKQILPTLNSSDKPTALCNDCGQKGLQVRAKFGTAEDFIVKASPQVQARFAAKQQAAVMGDYPTLRDINEAYGKNFAAEWLTPHLTDLSLMTGARNITEYQQQQLAIIIATDYHWLKVTELMIFFHWFKSGKYGKFYGATDPMTIICALRDFLDDRNYLIGLYEQEERERSEAEERKNAISYEEFLKQRNQTT